MARVLVATDGSDTAKAAALGARQILGEGHEWTVLAVADARPAAEGVVPVAGVVPSVVDPGTVAAVGEAADDAADDAAAHVVAALGPTAVARVVRGDPGASICEVAAEGFDVVVVGSHGAGLVRRVLMGSVSTYVVNHAPCPVLVVREGVGAGADD